MRKRIFFSLFYRDQISFGREQRLNKKRRRKLASKMDYKRRGWLWCWRLCVVDLSKTKRRGDTYRKGEVDRRWYWRELEMGRQVVNEVERGRGLAFCQVQRKKGVVFGSVWQSSRQSWRRVAATLKPDGGVRWSWVLGGYSHGLKSQYQY